MTAATTTTIAKLEVGHLSPFALRALYNLVTDGQMETYFQSCEEGREALTIACEEYGVTDLDDLITQHISRKGA